MQPESGATNGSDKPIAVANIPPREALLSSELKISRSSSKINQESNEGTDATAATVSEESCAIKEPPPKRVKRKHLDPWMLEVRITMQQCCARNDLETAMNAYDRAVREGIKVEAQSFYNLLNLCDGLGDRGLHVGTPKTTTTTRTELLDTNDQAASSEKKLTPKDQHSNEVSDVSAHDVHSREVTIEKRLNYARRIQRRMEELKLPLVETAFTALVKLYSKGKLLEEAEQLLIQAETVQQCRPKLRMYSPLLIAFCEDNDMTGALRVWHRLSQLTHGLWLTEKEYIALIECATRTGHAEVMERVLYDLSEDVLVPSRQACLAVTNWFQSPHSVLQPAKNQPKNQESFKADISAVEILAKLRNPFHGDPTEQLTIGPVQCENGWTADASCAIQESIGILETGCLKGLSLNPVHVSDYVWMAMKRMNETIVLNGKLDEDSSDFQGGRKGPKKKLDEDVLEERRKHWNDFQEYLHNRSQRGKVDIIVDGANVGYFQQNFAGAPKHVNYHQIDIVVRHLMELNKTVLVVMHRRHFASDLMPQEIEPMIRRWMDQDLLYRTPAGMNDDWFWLHAAISFGPGTLVLSNDEMRDHHFQMLAARSFVRWKDRHMVHFQFRDRIEDPNEANEQRQVLLKFPERYSRRIQRVGDGYVLPRAKRGDENRFLDGSFVATEDEPIEETYLCIRPKGLLDSNQ